MPATSPKPRILYIWQAAYPWDVRVEKICAALVRGGFDVEILARRGPEEAKRAVDAKGFAIHRVGPAHGPRALSLPVPGNPIWTHAIRARIREYRPALVIVRDIPLALPAARAARARQIPWVIDMAEHYPMAMRTWKKYQDPLLTRFAINTLKLPDRIEKRAVRLADGILPVIEEQKERLVREYACDPEKIIPVLNTPERERLPPEITGRRQSACFGYHGVVIQDRDLLTVIRGFDLAAVRNSEIALVIAGTGESAGDVREAIAACRHRERIQFTGQKFRPEEVAALYQAVDFGVVAWEVNDFTNNTIANKFFDYPAFGKPVLYAETRPMERLMRTMRCGAGYRGGDASSCAEAMLKLLAADYGELARRGRESIEREYNWDVDTRRMLAFLRELIGRFESAR